MGVRQAIADYVRGIADYLLGRDMDAALNPRTAPAGAGRGGRRRHRRRRDGLGDVGDGAVDLAEAVEEARSQWVAARKVFDHVTEPELIDYAVFAIGAAERRYMFLLAEARRRGVQVHPLGAVEEEAKTGLP